MVLSTFPPLLKLVWQNRVLNLGMDDTFPDWNENFSYASPSGGSLAVTGTVAQELKTSDPGKDNRGGVQGIGFA